jgi:hypothetical protein
MGETAPIARACLAARARSCCRRVDSELGKLISAGDPLFVIDILHTNQDGASLLCRIPTRASLLQAGLNSDGQQSILAEGGVPDALQATADARRKPRFLVTAIRWLRWWLLPLAFTLSSWAVTTSGSSWARTNSG